MVNSVNNNAAQQAFLNPFQQRQQGNSGQVQGQNQQQDSNNPQQTAQTNTQSTDVAQTNNTQAVQQTAESEAPPALQAPSESTSGSQQNFENAERGSLLDITV